MASTIKRRVALKGQSRSKFCGEPVKARSKVPCLRLSGHKGNHRPTTFRGGNERPVQTVKADEVEVTPNVTVLAAVEAERAVAAPPKRAKRAGTAKPSGAPSARLA